MHDAASQFSHLRLAIAFGVPSPPLSALLALQRAEEPEVTISFHEVTGDDLVTGLHEGRYDAGMSLQELPSLKSQSLWIEHMGVAIPLRFPLFDQATLTVSELLDYPVFRWTAEACPRLDQQLPASRQRIKDVTSFEMMALWVAAGYGVGVSAKARIERARGWGISARSLSDGPYEIVTHLQRAEGQPNPVAERFERRALQVARGT